MDSENGGLSSEERQRKTAAEIARKKVLDSYENPGQMKSFGSEKSGPKISSVEWQKYHSAWQNYYQKYYSEYYSNAAKQYVAQEKLKSEREKIEKDPIVQEPAKFSQDDVASRLREKVREKASTSNFLVNRRKKLMPILAGLTVVIVILFLQYNRLIFAPIAAYVSPGDVPAGEITAVDPNISVPVSDESKLIIPKLNIEVPVAFGISLDEVDSAMNQGVAHFRISGANAFPGEIGNTVISGHSAGDIYSNNQYKFIFSGLERLEEGDLAYINYNSTRYIYRITKKQVVEPTEVSALVYQTSKPMLTLITCTPLGTSRYRLLVTAEQISPTYENATSAQPTLPDPDEEDQNLPSNSPSFFEGIWNWLTGEE